MDIDRSGYQKILQSSMNSANILRYSFDRINKIEAQKKAAAYQADLEVVKQSKVLREIADNTAYLKDLVTIVRDIKLDGDESNLILKAVYNISESQTKEEAATNLSKAIAKISESGEFVGNMGNIISLLYGIYNTVVTMIGN